MVKEIGSLQRASIWWLIALIAAGLLHVAHCQDAQPECMTELFVELDNDDTNIAQAEKRLRAVFIEERDTTMIGTVSVAQILDLKDKKCDAVDLLRGDALLKESDFNCDLRPNRGAASFLREYGPRWQEFCAKEMESVWKETLELFPPEEEEILQDICPVSITGFLGKLVYLPKQNSICDEKTKASVLIDNSKSATERKNTLSGCHRLLIVMSTDRMKLLSDNYQSISRLFSRKRVCEYYLEYLCRTLDGQLTDDESEKCKGIQGYIPDRIKEDPPSFEQWQPSSN